MCRTLILALLAGVLFAGSSHASWPKPQEVKKDYLTESEADKIRDAMLPPDRIKLFVSFAEDRLKKFQSGCMDDAADQIALAQEKQIDIHGPLKTMQSKGKEFLATLNKLNEGGPEYETYKETLQDAIEGTKDALADADKAAKELTPAPVRRKPS
jgi:hypothetical protein